MHVEIGDNERLFNKIVLFIVPHFEKKCNLRDCVFSDERKSQRNCHPRRKSDHLMKGKKEKEAIDDGRRDRDTCFDSPREEFVTKYKYSTPEEKPPKWYQFNA